MEQNLDQTEPDEIQGVEGPPSERDQTRQQLDYVLKRTMRWGGGVHFLLFQKDPFLGKVRPFFDSDIDCFTNPERKMIAPSLVQGGRKGGVRLGVLGLENRLCDLEQDSHLLWPEFSLNQR